MTPHVMNPMNATPVPEARSFSFADCDALSAEIGSLPAHELLQQAMARFGRRLVVASSFGAEDVVLIDMAARIDPAVRIFTLDTGRLPEETWEVMERVRQRYGVSIEIVTPQMDAVARLVEADGPYSFRHSVEARRACCQIRKVEPLGRVLETADVWVTGLRRAQSVTRAQVETVELDLINGGRIKLAPLAGWTEDAVWNHIRERDVPFNRLHELGYPSIGCAPCTRPIAPGEDVRAGRWWWETPDGRECGLHVAH